MGLRALFKITAIAALLVSVALFSGCEKSARVRWVYYDETYCADRWTWSSNNEQLKTNIVSYMDSRGVKVYEIEIFRQEAGESCTACTCRTGRQIKCKIRRSDLEGAKAESFYE